MGDRFFTGETKTVSSFTFRREPLIEIDGSNEKERKGTF